LWTPQRRALESEQQAAILLSVARLDPDSDTTA
jgi:hypothetical protein